MMTLMSDHITQTQSETEMGSMIGLESEKRSELFVVTGEPDGVLRADETL